MNFLRKNLKYIISATVLIAVMLVGGIFNLNNVKKSADMSVSYLKTDFDFMLSAPTSEEIQTLKNGSSVKTVCPYFLADNIFTASKTAKKVVAFAVSDSYKNEKNVGFFNEKTLKSGSLTGGLVIDEKASSVLGLKVGDVASFIWGKKTVRQTVVGIIHSVSYEQFQNGVVMVDYTGELKSLLNIEERGYKGAFVVANDLENCDALLREIVDNELPRYNRKDEFYSELVKYKVETLQETINLINIGFAVGVPVIFALVGVVFILTSCREDEIERDGGKSKGKTLLERFLSSAIGGIAGAVISLAVLLGIAVKAGYLAEMLTTVLCVSLPVLVAVAVIFITAFLYANKLYKNSVGTI